MITLTLATVPGYKIKYPDGSSKTLISYDPYNECCTWDGYNAKLRDPCMGIIPLKQLRAVGVDIVPTEEERVMIEQGRLTIQVEEKAKALREVLDNWLKNDKAR